MRDDRSDELPTSENRIGERPTCSRYDLVLAVIPLAFLVSAVAASVTPVPIHVALLAGGAVGVVALVDALFRNPPGQPPSGSGRRE